MGRGLVLAAVAAAGLALAGAAAGGVNGPPLTSETFIGSGSPLGTGPLPFQGASCDPNGTSTLTYTSFGDAIGPYPGTYTESGTVKIGPQNGPAMEEFGFTVGALESIDARFTIQSLLGTVDGEKHLLVPLLGGIEQNRGTCANFTNRLVDNKPNANGTFTSMVAFESYSATISPVTGGSYTDGGTALGHFEIYRACDPDVQFSCTGLDFFYQVFLGSTALPFTTPGLATGGGQVGTDEAGIVFGLDAHSDANGLHGICTVVDRSTGTKVKCLNATGYAQTGTHAIVTGQADVNGATTNYRIDVDDLAEPGAGADTFAIQTDSGYTAGGTLTRGNIQVH